MIQRETVNQEKWTHIDKNHLYRNWGVMENRVLTVDHRYTKVAGEK
jgi:hypothetical protein